MRNYYLVLLILFFTFCTQPPSINNNQIQDLTSPLLNRIEPQKVRGSGTVIVNVNGKKYGGNVDIEFINNNSFHADIYSTFGNVVASIYGDTVHGTITYDNESYRFAIHTKMDTLPFAWGKEFTFAEFSELLTGNLNLIEPDLNATPDTLVNERTTTMAVWNSGERFNITALINRNRMILEEITLKDRLKSDEWEFEFRKLKDGIAHSMLFKQDEKNYFYVEYDNLKYF